MLLKKNILFSFPKFEQVCSCFCLQEGAEVRRGSEKTASFTLTIFSREIKTFISRILSFNKKFWFFFSGGSGGREEAAENQQGDRTADPERQTSLSGHSPTPPFRRRRVRQVHSS